jgi:SAM-dependent methyltransferase
VERDNRRHWDNLGAAYSENWAPPAKRVLSERELGFVDDHLPSRPGLVVLDVGVGNGRIVEHLLRRDEVAGLHGVDISAEMIEVCRRKFGDNPKLRSLQVCDVSTADIPVDGALDFVTSIRVLKYSRNWPGIVAKVVAKLAPGGVFVFTMPNQASATRLSRSYAVDYYLTTQAALRTLTEGLGCEVIDITGFTKLPDAAYRAASRPAAARALIGIERALDAVAGQPTLARELFVAVRRP